MSIIDHERALSEGFSKQAAYRFLFVATVALFCFLGLSEVRGEEQRLTFVSRRGDKFENAKVLRIDPDGVSLMHLSGITKVAIEDLPPEIRAQFGLNAGDAAQYRSRTAAAVRARDERVRAVEEQRAAEQERVDAQRDTVRAQRKQAEEDAKKKNAVYTWHFDGETARGRVVLVQNDVLVIRNPAAVGQHGTWAISLYRLPSSERELALWIGARLTQEERRRGERILNEYEKWLRQ